MDLPVGLSYRGVGSCHDEKITKANERNLHRKLTFGSCFFFVAMIFHDGFMDDDSWYNKSNQHDMSNGKMNFWV